MTPGWYWLRYRVDGAQWQIVGVHTYDPYEDDQYVTFSGFREPDRVKALGDRVEWGPMVAKAGSGPSEDQLQDRGSLATMECGR